MLEVIKPEVSLEASILNLRLSFFGHLMRGPEFLEKETMLDRIEGKHRRGRQRKRGIDTIKEDTNLTLEELAAATQDRDKWRSLVHCITNSRPRLNV